MNQNDGDIIILGDGQGGGFPNVVSDGGGHTETDPDGEEITVLGSRSGAIRIEPESEADAGS